MASSCLPKQLLLRKSRSLLVSGRIAAFSSEGRTRTDDEVKALFEKWAIKHGKSYEDPQLKEFAFENYRARLRVLDEHNSDPSLLDRFAADTFTGGRRATWVGLRKKPDPIR